MITPQNPKDPLHDPIGRLLRLAGPPDPIDSARVERVRAAVHEHWQTKVPQTRFRRSYLWLAAVASFVFVGLWILWLGNRILPGNRDEFVVERVTGTVYVQHPQDTSPERRLLMGDRLPPGSKLMASPSARAAIRLPHGVSLRLDGGARLVYAAANQAVLTAGAVYVDAGPARGPDSAIRLQTPFGEVRDIGTRFEVRLEEESMAVRVRDGSVVLTRGEKREVAGRGEALIAYRSGEIHRGDISVFDTTWTWTSDVAPPFRLEGQTLATYLDWVSGESGLRIQFEDPVLAEEASGVRLSGSTEGLRPLQSLDAVLPACGLTHRFDHGFLAIERTAALSEGL